MPVSHVEHGTDYTPNTTLFVVLRHEITILIIFRKYEKYGFVSTIRYFCNFKITESDTSILCLVGVKS